MKVKRLRRFRFVKRTAEVMEVSNDEPSSFTLTKQKQWYAVCEVPPLHVPVTYGNFCPWQWRLRHSLFEQGGKMDTGDFEVDGRRW